MRTHYVNRIEAVYGRSRVNVKLELLRLQATFHEYAPKRVNIARQWKSTFGDKTSTSLIFIFTFYDNRDV